MSPMSQVVSLTGIILAGGRSSRFKQNKALVKFGDQIMIERQIERLAQVSKEIVLVVNDPEPYRRLGVNLVLDRYLGKGPLAGIHAGLEAAKTLYSFVVACDMPFFSPDLLRYMVDLAPDYDVVVPYPRGFYEPVHAIYSRSCLPVIESTLQQEGVPRIISFYPRVKVRLVGDDELASFGQGERVFFNMNTPEDMQRAYALEENHR